MSLRRSIEQDSDMTQTKGYPFTLQTMANPIPVFPELHSTTVWSGFRCPSFSAHSMQPNAKRSFTLPMGLKNSHLTYMSIPGGARRFNLTRGVFPIVSSMLDAL